MASESESKHEKFIKSVDFSSGNLAAKWKVFKDQWAIYKVVKKIDAMDTEDEKICNLLMAMGSDAVPIYVQFNYSTTVNERKKTLANTIRFFDEYFEPVKNIIFERSVFNNMTQEQGESIHQFIVKIQTQSANCDYGAMKAELVRDRIVVGVRDNELRKYLIDTPDLTLEVCIQKAKQFVAHQVQVEKMSSSTATSKDSTEGEAANIDTLVQPDKDKKKQTGKNIKKGAQNLSTQCTKCGKNKHFGGKCPAEGTRCNRCKKIGHWGLMCEKSKKKISEIDESEEAMDSLFLGSD